MDWLRWHHGTVNNPKWRVVARKSNQRLGDVIAIWAALCERASKSDERGSITGWKADELAAAIDIDPDDVREIVLAMQDEKRAIDGDTLIGWSKYNPKRERDENDTSTDRVRNHRAKKRHNNNGDGVTTNETPCNTINADETPGNAHIRIEEIREDSGGGGAHDASATANGGTDLQPTEVEANRIIAHFQAVREELWPRCPNLTSPTMTLRDQATAFLNLGGTVPLINEMLERGMRTAAAKGKTATVSLKAFQNSITDAIADYRAGIQSQGDAHATAPRRAGQPRSFVDEVRAIDQAVSASRSHRMEPSGMAPVERDGKVIEGEFSAL
jgi:hypothetical protein